MPRLAPLLLFLCLPSLAWAEPDVQGRFSVVYEAERALLRGEGTLRVRNGGAEPLRDVPLVLYGKRFSRLDPKITDRNFDYYYVRWFDDGDMRLTRVMQGGVALGLAPVPDVLPPGTAVRVRLRRPLPPGETATIDLAWTLDVPDRLGPFGQISDRLRLEGGWLPYVPIGFDPLEPPQPAAWTLTLRSPAPLLLDGRPLASGETRTVVAPAPPLLAGSDLKPLLEVGPSEAEPGVEVYGPEGDEERAEAVARLIRDVGGFLHDRYGITPGTVAVAPAPLRDRFVHVAGDRTLLVSDRLFSVFVLLEHFHEAEVARGALQILIRQATADVPLGADRDWFCELAAWNLSRDWVKRRAGLEGSFIRDGLELFSFIPAFDRVVRAPRFSGSDIFYGRFYEPMVAVPDGFPRALSRRARGRVLAEKLRDRIGNGPLQTLLDETVREGAPARRAAFRERAEELAGEPLAPFFDLWLGPPPVQNLRIASVETVEKGEDSKLVRVRVKRDTEDERIGKVGDPVVVEGTGPDGKPVRGTWDGRGDEGEVELLLERALWSPVRLDPDQRLSQTIYADDQEPHLPVRILLNRFSLRIDLNNTNRNEAVVGLTMHPRFDYAHTVTLDAFYKQDERGMATRYFYSFGKVLDERRFGTSVGVGLNATRLTEGVLRGAVEETSGDLYSMNAGIGFDTRDSQISPLWGVSFGFGVEYADKWFGTDFRYVLYQGSIAFLTSIVRGTTIGVELKLGQVESDDQNPSQRLFDAGGEGSIRGVRASRFVGEAQFVVRTELRHMLIEDLDIPLFWLLWLRRIQLVAFMDTGDVGETIEDVVRWDPLWKWGAGGGIRLFVDAFGVSTLTVRLDVAVRFDEEAQDNDPQFYFGVNQSF